jgi:hypothetical protein
MQRFDTNTVQTAVAETKLMMETNFADTWVSPDVPVSGSSFSVHTRGDVELNVIGYVDPAAVSLYQTKYDYLSFREVDKKMAFTRSITLEEELPRLKDELYRVFWCQRAHVIAWSLWVDE